MLPTEAVLEQAAKDGSLDITEWPRTLEVVLSRLDHIASHEFPIPSIPRPTRILRPPFDPTSSSPLYGPKRDQFSDTASDQAEPRTSPQPSTSPPTPALRSAPTTHEPSTSTDLSEGTLPPPLLAILTFVKHSLETNFKDSPPHTIQRLAELILHPKQHYRHLPAYLNALDRIVAVSSGTTLFPLPSSEAAAVGATFVNGNATATTLPAFSLGSDESLGGALLTPIPWLRASHNNGSAQSTSQVNGIRDSTQDSIQDSDTIMTTVDDATEIINNSSNSSGNSSGNLRSNGALTQGELLRQEQKSSDPPAPLASAQNTTHILRTDPNANTIEANAEEPMDTDADVNANSDDREAIEGSQQQQPQQPHARGPDEIGLADTGKQEQHTVGGAQVLDMEAAVGRSVPLSSSPSSSPSSPPRPSSSAALSAATATTAMGAVHHAAEAGENDLRKEQSQNAGLEMAAENMQQDEMQQGEADGRKKPTTTSPAPVTAPPLEKESKDDEGDTIITDADGLVTDDTVGNSDVSRHAGADAAGAHRNRNGV